jgi:hypothetical protein
MRWLAFVFLEYINVIPLLSSIEINSTHYFVAVPYAQIVDAEFGAFALLLADQYLVSTPRHNCQLADRYWALSASSQGLSLPATSMTSSSRIVQFSPLTSTLSPEFWTAFSKLKIDHLQLSDAAVPVAGRYHPGKSVLDRETGQQLSLGTSIHFDDAAFSVESGSSASSSLTQRSEQR